jgi:hypothetical protein
MSICSTGLSDCEFGPLVVKPKGACRMLGCGITRLYELLNAGELDSFLDGRTRKITTASIRLYVAKRLALAHRTDEEPETRDVPTESHQKSVHTEGQRQTEAAGHLNPARSPWCTSVDRATAASLAARRQRKARRKRRPA